METKSSNLSVLLEEGVKRGRVKMDIETEIRYDEDDGDRDDEHDYNIIFTFTFHPFRKSDLIC